jgi:hypothetical protein
MPKSVSLMCALDSKHHNFLRSLDTIQEGLAQYFVWKCFRRRHASVSRLGQVHLQAVVIANSGFNHSDDI